MPLRRARPDDAVAIAAIYARYVRESTATFETDPPDAAAMAARMATGAEAQLPWLVALDDAGAIIGYAYAARFHPRFAYRYTVEPSVYLDMDRRGGGVGTALYEALLTIVTELGYRQAIALVTLPNPASEALHRRMGFHASGCYEQSGHKMAQWLDVGLFQKPLGTGADGPPTAEPASLAGSALWRGLE